MQCRYCHGVYAASERTCGGCGAPKTAVQTLLDVPAAPDHWSRSMMETVRRVAIGSAGVGVVAILLSLIGLDSFGAFIAFLWMMPLAPMGLALGAWQSSIGDFGKRMRNFIVAGLLWTGIFFAMLLVIGLTVAT